MHRKPARPRQQLPAVSKPPARRPCLMSQGLRMNCTCVNSHGFSTTKDWTSSEPICGILNLVCGANHGFIPILKMNVTLPAHHREVSICDGLPLTPACSLSRSSEKANGLLSSSPGFAQQNPCMDGNSTDSIKGEPHRGSVRRVPRDGRNHVVVLAHGMQGDPPIPRVLRTLRLMTQARWA